jgi:cation diffusion facilitator family transporter
VLAGLLVVVFFPGWVILDPLIAIAVGLHIVVTGVDLLRRSIDGLMDAALSPTEIAKAEELIRAELPAGTSFHALRTRKSGAARFIDFHLLLPGETTVTESHALCDRLEDAIARHLAKVSITIHVEPLGQHEPAPGAARTSVG